MEQHSCDITTARYVQRETKDNNQDRNTIDGLNAAAQEKQQVIEKDRDGQEKDGPGQDRGVER